MVLKKLVAKFGFPQPAHVGEGIYAIACAVRPDDAAEILLNHHIDNNRRLRPHHLKLYEHDLTKAKWGLTHQGIAFNSEGLLCDGQHRLTACVKSNVPLRTIIFFGVPSENVPLLDEGARRSVCDAAKVKGSPVNTKEPGVVRWAALGRHQSISKTASMELLALFEEGREFLRNHLPSHVHSVTISPMLGAILRAYYSSDTKRLAKMCEVIRSGVCEDTHDRAAVTLVRFLTSKRGAGGTFQAEVFQKTCSAVRNFMHCKAVTKLYVPNTALTLPRDMQQRVGRIVDTVFTEIE